MNRTFLQFFFHIFVIGFLHPKMKNCLVVHLAFKNPIFLQSTSKIQVMGTKPDPSLVLLDSILRGYKVLPVLYSRKLSYNTRFRGPSMMWDAGICAISGYTTNLRPKVILYVHLYNFYSTIKFFLLKSKYINDIKRMENNFCKCHDILMMNVFILLFIFLCKQ